MTKKQLDRLTQLSATEQKLSINERTEFLFLCDIWERDYIIDGQEVETVASY